MNPNSFQNGAPNNAPVNPYANQGIDPALGINNATPKTMPQPVNPVNSVAPQPNPTASEKAGAGRVVALIIACATGVASVIFLVAMFLGLNSLKKNNETDTLIAVETARYEQQVEDENRYIEEDKSPWLEFTGVPDDLGAMRFEYPRTWKVYVAENNLTEYRAYFRPSEVLPIDDDRSRYALRLSIVSEPYSAVFEDYKAKAEDGLTHEGEVPLAADSSESMTVFSGTIDENLEGKLILMSINDKTLIMQTDSEVYLDDFNKILDTLVRKNKY